MTDRPGGEAINARQNVGEADAASPWRPSRRTVLAGALSLAAVPAFSAARVLTPESFLAVGDWGREGSRIQRSVARGMGVAGAELSSRFVLATGDNFYPAGVASVRDPHWKRSFENVYTAESLQTPWYAALGNHDYRGKPRSQVHYARHSHRWRMPSRRYHVTPDALGTPAVELFVLDTSPIVDRHDFGERFQQLRRGRWWKMRRGGQVAWLEEALQKSTARYKVVVGHHPIYSAGSHGDTPDLVARIAPVLERGGVTAYINGHDHILQHVRRSGVSYVCSGAGAGGGPARRVQGAEFYLGKPGFAAFQVTSAGLLLQMRGADGAVIHQSVLGRV
jgi:tartrate-resistant acid phosphatase type 5